MTTRPLTARQDEILSFIRTYRVANGNSPTLREIGKALGIGSTNGVHDHLTALERKGYLERDMGKSRGLRVMYVKPADVDRLRIENGSLNSVREENESRRALLAQARLLLNEMTSASRHLSALTDAIDDAIGHHAPVANSVPRPAGDTVTAVPLAISGGTR